MTDVEYRTEQKDLRKQIYSLYGDFDSYAWWVLNDISCEASVVGTIPKEKIAILNGMISDFNTNLVGATRQISVSWDDCLGPRHNSTDVVKREKVANEELAKLQQSRATLIERMVHIFE